MRPAPFPQQDTAMSSPLEERQGVQTRQKKLHHHQVLLQFLRQQLGVGGVGSLVGGTTPEHGVNRGGRRQHPRDADVLDSPLQQKAPRPRVLFEVVGSVQSVCESCVLFGWWLLLAS